MRSLYVFPYNPGSESAKLLARELTVQGGFGDVKRIKNDGTSRFIGNMDKIVINWGSRELTLEVAKCKLLNSIEAVKTCANKLNFFEAMRQESKCRYVPFTTKKSEAQEWLDKEKTVVARLILNGHSGHGLEVVEPDEILPDAPLYTLYIPKKEEFRIHVFNGKAFIVQRKALRNDFDSNSANWKVRNLVNGFIFARNEDQKPPQDVIDQAEKAALSIPGLLFGSVDVVWNEHRKEAYVLEINTASGLTGSTITDYANKFKEYLSGKAA